MLPGDWSWLRRQPGGLGGEAEANHRQVFFRVHSGRTEGPSGGGSAVTTVTHTHRAAPESMNAGPARGTWAVSEPGLHPCPALCPSGAANKTMICKCPRTRPLSGGVGSGTSVRLGPGSQPGKGRREGKYSSVSGEVESGKPAVLMPKPAPSCGLALSPLVET